MKRIILALTIMIMAASFVAADTIYLRDGRTLRGTLLGFVDGRFVVRVDRRYASDPNAPLTRPDRTDTGDIQYFRPDEVERIEIEGRALDDVRFETRTVQVNLEPNWIDTGIDLRRNQRVRINASGTILAGRSRITPEGLRTTDPTAPLPNASEGELVGAIGDDPYAPIIELGASREFVADRSGRLYLTPNRGAYTDARGSFTVQVRRERSLTTSDTAEDIYAPRSNQPAPARPRSRQPVDEIARTRTAQEVTINVPATSRGTDTGLDVRVGDRLTFAASGTIVAGRRTGQVGPEGGRSSGFGAIIGTRPVPTSGPGALIGYIRLPDGQQSQPFLVGNQLTFTAPVDGRLYLAINDDDYSDNSGNFSVKIRY